MEDHDDIWTLPAPFLGFRLIIMFGQTQLFILCFSLSVSFLDVPKLSAD